MKEAAPFILLHELVHRFKSLEKKNQANILA